MKSTHTVILASFGFLLLTCLHANAGINIQAVANSAGTEVTYTYSGTFDTGVLKVGNGGGSIGGLNRVARTVVFSNPSASFTSNVTGTNPSGNQYVAETSSTFVETGFHPLEDNNGSSSGATSNRIFRVERNQGIDFFQLQDGTFTLGDVLTFSGSWTATNPRDRTGSPIAKSAFEATGSWDWTFTGNGTSDTVSLNFSAVPEPSTYAAIFGGLALAVATMRRKGRRSL